MASADAPWWIITGAAAALHGVVSAVADVDVLLHERDAERLLSELGLPTGPGLPHPRYRSTRFARWAKPPIPVEFMAGFHLDGQRVEPRTRERIVIGKSTLYVPARGELAAMLRALGRPKDLARAAALTS